MKVTILQKGGRKNHEVLDEATRFYASKLMSTRMMNTLNLRIEVRSTILPKNWAGSCSAKVNGSQSTKDFTIVLQRDHTLGEQLKTLAHEVVHVWQKARNTLQYRLWKSDNQVHVRWNGREMGTQPEIPYYDRPWEKEAFFLEEHLFELYKSIYAEENHKIPQLEQNLQKAIRCVTRSREKEMEAELS